MPGLSLDNHYMVSLLELASSQEALFVSEQAKTCRWGLSPDHEKVTVSCDTQLLEYIVLANKMLTLK